MSDESVLAYLADRFPAGRENLATEALTYILGRSKPARLAVSQVLAPIGAQLGDDLVFESQAAADEGSIPDLVGRDPSGHRALIIESKFWAGLTAQQPNGYLHLLRETAPSALVFLAPDRRVETLWPELIRRVKEDHILDTEPNGSGDRLRWQVVDGRRVIALTTWTLLLDAIRHAVERDGDRRIVGDVDQLLALCGRVDSEAFEPVRDEELAQSTGRRIMQYCDLVDDVISNVSSNQWASTEGFRKSGGKGYYNRFIRLHSWGCTLRVSSSKWSRLAATPLWLEVNDQAWKPSRHVRDALASLSAAHPPEVLIDDGRYQVPLFITPGMDRDGVLASLLSQFERVTDLIGEYVGAHPEAIGADQTPDLSEDVGGDE